MYIGASYYTVKSWWGIINPSKAFNNFMNDFIYPFFVDGVSVEKVGDTKISYMFSIRTNKIIDNSILN